MLTSNFLAYIKPVSTFSIIEKRYLSTNIKKLITYYTDPKKYTKYDVKFFQINSFLKVIYV
ncbi:hypothetical protein FHS70_002405 [Flammeovirga yaeyamensis]|nr:hypothetical protein [Flammeovirga yaeyamensis]